MRLTAWNTKPTLSWRNAVSRAGLNELISTPSTVTVPLVAVSRPPAMEHKVVLPDPDGPTSATSSPASTVRSTASRATMSLSPRR
jgi:hypothetical protein